MNQGVKHDEYLWQRTYVRVTYIDGTFRDIRNVKSPAEAAAKVRCAPGKIAHFQVVYPTA